MEEIISEADDPPRINPNKSSKLPSGGGYTWILALMVFGAIIWIDQHLMNKGITSLKTKTKAPMSKLSDETSQRCGADWELHGGTCYHFSTNESSWTESRSSCRVLGGDLVKIGSREEQIFLGITLRDVMREEEDKFWIGLTNSEEDGRWFWMDGSPLNESLSFWPDNWTKGNRTGEDCVRMGRKEAADVKCWYDESCLVPHRSIRAKAAGIGPGSSACV